MPGNRDNNDSEIGILHLQKNLIICLQCRTAIVGVPHFYNYDSWKHHKYACTLLHVHDCTLFCIWQNSHYEFTHSKLLMNTVISNFAEVPNLQQGILRFLNMQINFHNTHIRKITYAKQQGESHKTCQEHFHFIFQLKEKIKWTKNGSLFNFFCTVPSSSWKLSPFTSNPIHISHCNAKMFTILSQFSLSLYYLNEVFIHHVFA